MNCDQVFEILTRGPFPTNSSVDVNVERHLAACHECREMAEALRPAVALFHESLSANEAESLPGYRGEMSPASGVERMVATVMAEPLPRPEKPASPLAANVPSNLWFVLAGVALSAFAIGLWCASTVHNSAANRETAGRYDRVPDLLRLASLKLPADCRPTAANRAKTRVAEEKFSISDLTCCRNCHVTLSDSRPPPNALAVVANSCSACH